MSFDLTLDNYRSLCRAIKHRQSDCRVLNHLDSAENNSTIILRHDVDRKPKRALRMARIESDVGVRSTYYFRSTKEAFIPEIMKEIEKMGHEVGYHYEVLVKAKGDHVQAMKLFENDIDSFREHVEIRSICSHGSPLSKYDSRDIWADNSFLQFGIVGDASISVFGFAYYSDTGGKWDSKANLRDNVKSDDGGSSVSTTSEIIELLINNNNVYINCHPERWTLNIVESVNQSIKDTAINVVKLLIKFARRNG